MSRSELKVFYRYLFGITLWIVLDDVNTFLFFFLPKSQLLDRAQLYSGGAQKNSPCEVLYAAAWVAGEFSE